MSGRTEDVEFSIVHELEPLMQLESDWNALWNSANAPYLSQSFAWCVRSWREVARKRGCQLFCVVGRNAGKVVLIWPMSISSRYGFRIISQLGPEGSEYCLVLCAPGPSEISRVQGALDFVSRRSGADVIRLNYIRLETSLGKSLPALKGPQFRTIGRTSWISWEGIDDWQTYLARNMKPSHLQKHERRRRKFAQLGVVRFELVEDAEQYLETMDWLLNHKYLWIEAKGRTNAWLLRQDYINFLRSHVALNEESSGLRLFRITVDGRIVAAELAAVTSARVELFNAAYDGEWSKYSPGHHLDEEMVRWAFDRGLVCDFRFGSEPYKATWCNRFGSLASVKVALTWKGALIVAYLHLNEIKRGLKEALQRRIITPQFRESLRRGTLRTLQHYRSLNR